MLIRLDKMHIFILESLCDLQYTGIVACLKGVID